MPKPDQDQQFIILLVLMILALDFVFKINLNTTAKFSAYLLLSLIYVFKPSIISPATRGWLIVAKPLSLALSALSFGLIFFLLVSPFSLVGRLFGYDPLLCMQNKYTSSWNTNSSHVRSMKDQY